MAMCKGNVAGPWQMNSTARLWLFAAMAASASRSARRPIVGPFAARRLTRRGRRRRPSQGRIPLQVRSVTKRRLAGGARRGLLTRCLLAGLVRRRVAAAPAESAGGARACVDPAAACLAAARLAVSADWAAAPGRVPLQSGLSLLAGRPQIAPLVDHRAADIPRGECPLHKAPVARDLLRRNRQRNRGETPPAPARSENPVAACVSKPRRGPPPAPNSSMRPTRPSSSA